MVGACPRATPKTSGANKRPPSAKFKRKPASGRVLAPLGSIDYWFTVSGHRVHKTVHHSCSGHRRAGLTIENDPDHEAVDVAWVKIDGPGQKAFLPQRTADR